MMKDKPDVQRDVRSPKDIYKSMKRVNFWLHFFRNNPRFKSRFYHEFINWVGYDNWNDVKPMIRNSWDSASNSFDKMFGLIASFSRFSSRDEIISPRENKASIAEKAEDEKSVSELDAAVDSMKKAIGILTTVYEYENKCCPAKNEYECFLKLFDYFSNAGEDKIKTIVLNYLKSKTEEK